MYSSEVFPTVFELKPRSHDRPTNQPSAIGVLQLQKIRVYQ